MTDVTMDIADQVLALKAEVRRLTAALARATAQVARVQAYATWLRRENIDERVADALDSALTADAGTTRRDAPGVSRVAHDALQRWAAFAARVDHNPCALDWENLAHAAHAACCLLARDLLDAPQRRCGVCGEEFIGDVVEASAEHECPDDTEAPKP